MWKTRTFKTKEEFDAWVQAHNHNYQWEIIFVNNAAWAITYKPLRRIG